MLFEELADFFSLWIEFVVLNQLYHILGIFQDSSRMPMFHGMAFQREQMHKRNDPHARRAGGAWYRVGLEF